MDLRLRYQPLVFEYHLWRTSTMISSCLRWWLDRKLIWALFHCYVEVLWQSLQLAILDQSHLPEEWPRTHIAVFPTPETSWVRSNVDCSTSSSHETASGEASFHPDNSCSMKGYEQSRWNSVSLEQVWKILEFSIRCLSRWSATGLSFRVHSASRASTDFVGRWLQNWVWW